MDPAPKPPGEQDPTDNVLRDLKKERVAMLGEMYKKLAGLYAIERDLMIHRAVKRGYMTAYQAADASDLTPASIYTIIEKVESGEYGIK